MQYSATITERIDKRNKALDRHTVRRVLILYEEKVFFIGDTCLRFDKFRYCRMYFSAASVDLNISNNERFLPQYHALLAHNPYIGQVTASRPEDIDYDRYDVIVCVMPEEARLLSILDKKYREAIGFAVVSLSSIYINQAQHLNVIPRYDGLIDFYRRSPNNQLHELYIDDGERSAADKWLEAQGVRDMDDLFIFLDSSGRRDKLLRMDVYFSVVKTLLSRPNTRILIFDEKNMGKEAFYREWLGKELSSHLIFSRKLPLREDLALLGSSYTKMVFGPCTGLLHCAAGIFNRSVKDGMPASKVPVLIGYTGKYERPGESAADWWDSCPLVTCLLIKDRQGTRQMVELSSLPPIERKRTDNVLACQDYTSEMLLGAINRKLEKFRRAQTIKI